MTTDELIDYNLKLLYDSKRTFYRIDFSHPTKPLSGTKTTKLAEEMISRDLIIISNMKCTLTKFGRDISDNGGWLKHLENKNLSLEKTELKSHLEIENLRLQNENLEYSKTLRQKEKEIRDLTRDNLRLNNWDIRFRWYIAFGSFVSGIIVKYLTGN